MSKKKEQKKSDKTNEKIELNEISAEETATLPFPPAKKSRARKAAAPAAVTVETVEPAMFAPLAAETKEITKPGCRVRVIPALSGKKDNGYEELAASAINEIIADGYELLCVVPSANAKKLVAFFKLAA